MRRGPHGGLFPAPAAAARLNIERENKRRRPAVSRRSRKAAELFKARRLRTDSVDKSVGKLPMSGLSA